MFVTQVSATYNGVVLFDPLTLSNTLGELEHGANLFERFMSCDEGDDVLDGGAIVPILAIDDDGYEIVVRFAHEPSWFMDKGADREGQADYHQF